MEVHLQSAVRLHLDLACLKLNNTEVKLNNTEVKLNDTEAELHNTKVRLNDTQKKLETTTKLVQEFNTRIFIWKINDFSDILRQAKTGEKNVIESVPFFTDRTESYGYKIKVEIYPNGDESGENTHLTLYIVVMKGEYDAILPWPFKKKVKLTLIDQQEDQAKRKNITDHFTPDDDPECFARPVNEENIGNGWYKFISHKELNSRRYLVDDTLFLQVEVGP